MLIKEKTSFTNKAEKVKNWAYMMESILLLKMNPKVGNLYKEAIPKRGDCKKKLKNYNGNGNKLEFHQVLTLL